MLYVNGLGYVEDPVAFARPSSQVKAEGTKNDFNNILNGILSDKDGQSYTLKEIFEQAAQKYGLSTNLLEAVAYRESGFNILSTSSSGAMGLMQLMPGTAAELGVTDAYDAYQNVMGGARYLKQLYDRFGGDLSLVLVAYNAGPGTVRKYGGIPDNAGVQRYVSDILSLLEEGVDVPDKTVNTNASSNSSSNSNNTGYKNQQGYNGLSYEAALWQLLNM